jgi:hypothetical protein
MSSKDEVKTPDIIEEIIPGKNDDYDNKSLNLNNNNTQEPLIENYDEKESAQAVLEVSEGFEKNIESNKAEEAGNQMSRYGQAISYTQGQTSQTTKEMAENCLEFQKQALNSFQSVFMPYFQNIQNQFWNNQEFFKRISAMYYKLVSEYTESVITYSRIFNEVASSNMNFLRNAFNSSSSSSSSSANQERRMSSFKVDSGRNSDESSTNVRATFSCETCGQIFDSRQDLKEHASITHFK